jgi:hypothetical protein
VIRGVVAPASSSIRSTLFCSMRVGRCVSSNQVGFVDAGGGCRVDNWFVVGLARWQTRHRRDGRRLGGHRDQHRVPRRRTLQHRVQRYLDGLDSMRTLADFRSAAEQLLAEPPILR